MSRNLNIGLGVDFQPGLQSGLVQNRGADMIHEIGVACPKCRNEDVFSGLRDDGKQRRRSPYCKRCGGDGWLFRDGILTRGLAVGIRQQKNIHDVGLAQPGDMVFSVDPGFFGGCGQDGRRVSRDDKFTSTWSQPLDDGQTIVRGAATLGENKDLREPVDDSEDRLWYEPESALWCEDEDGTVYKQDADFVLGPGRVIKWVGNQPLKGTKYTLKYNAYFEWLVFAPPQERRDRDNKDLGPLVFLRRRHIAFVNDSSVVTEDDRQSLKSRISC